MTTLSPGYDAIVDEFLNLYILKSEELYCFCEPVAELEATRTSLEIDQGEIILRCNNCKKRAMEEVVAKLQMSGIPVHLELKGPGEETIVTVRGSHV